MSDPIVEEIHRIREAYAASMDHDLKKMLADFRARQGADGREVVSRPPRRPPPKAARLKSTSEIALPNVDIPPTTSTSPSVPD